ncbi:MAG: twin-arginine translocation signal domain-containing protein, partial [Selenomonadaceae bacterium]|nr:twin-arginine translocation signal domain-containing protein [Selenomonadaceae bacterium]
MRNTELEKNFLIPISRRDFFKIAGLTTAGAVLSNTIDIEKVEAANINSGEKIKYAGKNIPVLY